MADTDKFVFNEESPIENETPDFSQSGYLSNAGIPDLQSPDGQIYDQTNHLIGSTILPSNTEKETIDDSNTVVSTVSRNSTSDFTAIKFFDPSDELITQEILLESQVWWALDDTGNDVIDSVGDFDMVMSGNTNRQVQSLHSFNSATEFVEGQAIRATLPEWVYEDPRNMTIAFWMKHSGDFSGGSPQTILTDAINDDGASTKNHQFLVDIYSDSRIRLFWEYGTGTNEEVSFDPPVAFDVTQTHHYAIARNSVDKTVDFFIDGQLIESSSYATNPTGSSSYEWILGAYRDDDIGLTRYLTAVLQDVSLYKDSLTLEQVQYLYNGGQGIDYNAIV